MVYGVAFKERLKYKAKIGKRRGIFNRETGETPEKRRGDIAAKER